MSSDGQRTKILQNYREWPIFTSVSLLVDEVDEIQRQLMQTILSLRKIHQGFEYFQLFWRAQPKRRRESAPKNHQGLGDSEDESDAKIFSVPDSEIGQQSSPHTQLKLMRRQPQQGKTDRVLVEYNFDTTPVLMGIKSFPQSLYNVICKCTINTLLDDSNLNAFQTFWPTSNIHRLVLRRSLKYRWW